MARINICGFETGDMSEAMAYSGDVSVISGNRTGGNGSYILQCPAGSIQHGQFTLGSIDGAGVQGTNYATMTSWTRFWVNVQNEPASSTLLFALWSVAGDGGYRKAAIWVEPDMSLRVTGYFDVTAIQTAGGAISINTWNRLKLHVTDTGLEFFINGTSVVNFVDFNVGPDGAAQWVFGADQSYSPPGTTLYFDDIVIDDHFDPGDYSVIVYKKPTNSPFNTTSNMTKVGGATAADCISTIDDDTTYLSTSAGSEFINFFPDSAATPTVTGRVPCVKLFTRAETIAGEGDFSQPNLSMGLRWDGVSATTIINPSTGGYFNYFSIVQRRPDTNQWINDYDTGIAEIVNDGSSANPARITTFGYIVESDGEYMSPPLTGCQGWFDSADVTTTFAESSEPFATPLSGNSNYIGAWTDKIVKSPPDYVTVNDGENEPYLNTSSAGIVFTGNQYMLPPNGTNYIDGSGHLSVYVVYMTGNVGSLSDQGILSSTNSNQLVVSAYSNSGNPVARLALNDGTSGAAFSDAPLPSAYSVQSFEWLGDIDVYCVTTNGTISTQGDYASTGIDPQAVNIGNVPGYFNTVPDNSWSTEIAEVVIYHNQPEEDRAATFDYFATKYGLSIPTVDPLPTVGGGGPGPGAGNTYNETGSGGMGIGGTADVSVVYNRVGSGGVGIGGVATYNKVGAAHATYNKVGSGGLGIGGTAVVEHKRTAVTSFRLSCHLNPHLFTVCKLGAYVPALTRCNQRLTDKIIVRLCTDNRRR